jgi:hypothetical protein
MEIKGEILMNADRLQLGRGFWVRWVLASGTGLLVGFTAYFLLVVGTTSEQGLVLKTLVSAFGGAILGIAVGGAQMFVLWREVSGINRWMVANLIGGVIGGVVAFPIAKAVGDAMGFNMAVFAGGIVLGLSLGIAQVFVLRQHFFGSRWWVLAHAVGIPFGWALGRGLGESIYNILVGGVGVSTAQVIANLTTVILFFGGYGMITGGILVRLLVLNERN